MSSWAYSRHVLHEAGKNCFGTVNGVVIGLMIGVLSLLIGLALGGHPDKTLYGWIVLLAPSLLVITALFLGHLWRAAWLKHRDDFDESECNYGLYLDRVEETKKLRRELRQAVT